MNEANLLCIRFEFGVPLEDIFPPNDIHPKLYNLFYQTFLSFKNSDLLLEQILRSRKISVIEALNLKNFLDHGTLNYSNEISASSYFWLLRHFFGLLPLPLFPKFTDGQFYNWHYLAKHSKAIHMRSNRFLLSEISWWIHKLPKANILLIYTLMNFLRKIALKRYSLKKLSWRNVKMISLYFSSSLFARPFMPGVVSEMDSLYYPLLAYMIIHWHKIEKEKVDNFYHLERQLSSIWEDNDLCYKFIKSQLIDCGCQTSNNTVISSKNENEEVEDKESTTVFINKGMETEKSEIEIIEAEEKDETIKAEQLEGEEYRKSTSEDEVNVSIQDKENLVTPKLNCKLNNNADKIQSEPMISRRHNSDSPLYEVISEEKIPMKSSSETAIFKKKTRKFLTPRKIFHHKFSKVNISLVNVISKVNKKLKSKHENIRTKSGAKLENIKYDLLQDSDVKKAQSLHRNNFIAESPNIKYEKLKTL